MSATLASNSPFDTTYLCYYIQKDHELETVEPSPSLFWGRRNQGNFVLVFHRRRST